MRKTPSEYGSKLASKPSENDQVLIILKKLGMADDIKANTSKIIKQQQSEDQNFKQLLEKQVLQTEQLKSQNQELMTQNSQLMQKQG